MRWMMTLTLLALVPAARAGDAELGRQVFQAACSSCHVALPAAQAGADATSPRNLALWARTGSGPAFRAWVRSPWAVRPDSRCDPRRAPAQAVNDLLTYLRGVGATAPAPTRAPQPTRK